MGGGVTILGLSPEFYHFFTASQYLLEELFIEMFIFGESRGVTTDLLYV